MSSHASPPLPQSAFPGHIGFEGTEPGSDHFFSLPASPLLTALSPLGYSQDGTPRSPCLVLCFIYTLVLQA